MNHHKNGEAVVGEPGSYQYLLSATRDLLRGKPTVYEVFALGERVKNAGELIGLTPERINRDWADCHAKHE